MAKSSYFKNRMLPLVISVGITYTDDVDKVLGKFEKLKGSISKNEFKAVKSFLKSYWDIEKTLTYKKEGKEFPIYSDWHPGFTETHPNTNPSYTFRDPVLDKNNTVIVKTPENKFVKTDDTMFLRCPSCGGRLLPQFSFCPYCGFENTKLPNGTPTEPITVPKIPDTQPHIEPNHSPCMEHNQPQPFMADTIVEDKELGKVSKQDLLHIKEIEKYLPTK